MYGFISGSGGFHFKMLSMVSRGNRVWVNAPGESYVGFVEVIRPVDRVDILDREIHGVKINAVFFKVFKDGEREYQTRAWLREPESSGRTAGASTSALHSVSSPKGD